MVGARGSALEWALALLRAPGERHALRQKPLPLGMDRLLGVAAGAMPDALAEAARDSGETEARVQEAAQFYAREVLLHAQADAYRVLGVEADADAEQIKAHYRLLQHWLHPDRMRDEDDAIFAARVNIAWNRLRSRERRKAYDEAFRQDDAPETFDAGSALRSVPAWAPEAEIPHSRWRQRLPVLVLTVSSILLVMLILRDMDGRPDTWQDAEHEKSVGTAAGDGLGISVPRRDEGRLPESGPRKLAERVRNAIRHAIADPELHDATVATVLHAPEAVPQARLHSREMAGQAIRIIQAPVSLSANDEVQAQIAAPVIADAVAVAHRGAPASINEQAQPVPTSRPAAEAPTLPDAARVRQAWATGDQLLRYMAAVGRPPPAIWNSPVIQSSANRMRQDLHDTGRVRLSAGQWQIGNENAVLTSAYAVQGENASAGRMTADMVWREDRWLVIGLSMERTQ